MGAGLDGAWASAGWNATTKPAASITEPKKVVREVNFASLRILTA
jgi:hypothetical protein